MHIHNCTQKLTVKALNTWYNDKCRSSLKKSIKYSKGSAKRKDEKSRCHASRDSRWMWQNLGVGVGLGRQWVSFGVVGLQCTIQSQLRHWRMVYAIILYILKKARGTSSSCLWNTGYSRAAIGTRVVERETMFERFCIDACRYVAGSLSRPQSAIKCCADQLRKSSLGKSINHSHHRYSD